MQMVGNKKYGTPTTLPATRPQDFATPNPNPISKIRGKEPKHFPKPRVPPVRFFPQPDRNGFRYTLAMPKGASTVALVLMLSLAQLASADVIYTYTGNPFTDISGPWNLAFGSDPTEITVTIDVPNPFPTQSQFFGFPCGSFGSTFVYPGIGTPGIPGDSISDGLRTFAPDVVYLDGCGTTIQHWKIAGGFYALQPNSDDRAMYTSNVVSPQTAVGTGDVTI